MSNNSMLQNQAGVSESDIIPQFSNRAQTNRNLYIKRSSGRPRISREVRKIYKQYLHNIKTIEFATNHNFALAVKMSASRCKALDAADRANRKIAKANRMLGLKNESDANRAKEKAEKDAADYDNRRGPVSKNESDYYADYSLDITTTFDDVYALIRTIRELDHSEKDFNFNDKLNQISAKIKVAVECQVKRPARAKTNQFDSWTTDGYRLELVQRKRQAKFSTHQTNSGRNAVDSEWTYYDINCDYIHSDKFTMDVSLYYYYFHAYAYNSSGRKMVLYLGTYSAINEHHKWGENDICVRDIMSKKSSRVKFEYVAESTYKWRKSEARDRGAKLA